MLGKVPRRHDKESHRIPVEGEESRVNFSGEGTHTEMHKGTETGKRVGGDWGPPGRALPSISSCPSSRSWRGVRGRWNLERERGSGTQQGSSPNAPATSPRPFFTFSSFPSSPCSPCLSHLPSPVSLLPFHSCLLLALFFTPLIPSLPSLSLAPAPLPSPKTRPSVVPRGVPQAIRSTPSCSRGRQ